MEIKSLSITVFKEFRCNASIKQEIVILITFSCISLIIYMRYQYLAILRVRKALEITASNLLEMA